MRYLPLRRSAPVLKVQNWQLHSRCATKGVDCGDVICWLQLLVGSGTVETLLVVVLEDSHSSELRSAALDALAIVTRANAVTQERLWGCSSNALLNIVELSYADEDPLVHGGTTAVLLSCADL